MHSVSIRLFHPAHDPPALDHSGFFAAEAQLLKTLKQWRDGLPMHRASRARYEFACDGKGRRRAVQCRRQEVSVLHQPLSGQRYCALPAGMFIHVARITAHTGFVTGTG